MRDVVLSLGTLSRQKKRNRLKAVKLSYANAFGVILAPEFLEASEFRKGVLKVGRRDWAERLLGGGRQGVRYVRSRSSWFRMRRGNAFPVMAGAFNRLEEVANRRHGVSPVERGA